MITIQITLQKHFLKIVHSNIEEKKKTYNCSKIEHIFHTTIFKKKDLMKALLNSH